MSTRYYVLEDNPAGPTLRGGALKLWTCRAPECLLSGPSETGKTTAALHKLHALLVKYAGAQGVLCRKVRDTVFPTVLQTYRKRILGPESPVRAYGGERPTWFDYPNGSRLWIAGLDRSDKALSSERDFVLVNQAEELSEDDWQVLSTRTTGRAGNAPYGQLMGDCNPGPPTHWIKRRDASGPLVLIESRHEDNPSLWDGAGWTEQGRRTMAALDALTGVRYQRLRLGQWRQAEGVVYPGWDPAVHLIDAFPIPKDWPRYWAVDFGYTAPFVCQFWAEDPDGRLYLYREWVRTQMLVEDHARQLRRLCGAELGWDRSREPRPRAVIADHDAEGVATLRKHLALPILPARKAVGPGIEAVAARLRKAGDGRPRLLVLRGALVGRDAGLDAAKRPQGFAEEIDSYRLDDTDGKKQGALPVKEDDHSMDAGRYLVAHFDLVNKQTYRAAETPATTIADTAPDGVY